MKLYAPQYYLTFSCIADRCTHSCCIGWEIDVDDSTLEKYHALSDDYGKSIRDSIDPEGIPHFRLGEHDRCPHLDPRGLCRIICNCGEDYLCEICREHPRFYSDTPHGREVGLGMACEEACRIILGSDAYGKIIPIGEVEGDPLYSDFDPTARREQIYRILDDSTLPYADRLRQIHTEYGVSPAILSDSEWHALCDSLEYLSDADRLAFSAYSSALDTPLYLEAPLRRALAYFIYRHCTPAETADEFRASLGLSLFCERLLASLLRADLPPHADATVRAARTLSEELEYSEENTASIRAVFIGQ